MKIPVPILLTIVMVLDQRVMGASTLTGNDVYNRKEENLGSIKEIMLDMHTGNICYAVLSGISWNGRQAICRAMGCINTLDTVNQCFLLNMDADQVLKR